MVFAVIFIVGMLASVPLLLSVLWLAARIGDLLPDDIAEAALAKIGPNSASPRQSRRTNTGWHAHTLATAPEVKRAA